MKLEQQRHEQKNGRVDTAEPECSELEHRHIAFKAWEAAICTQCCVQK